MLRSLLIILMLLPNVVFAVDGDVSKGDIYNPISDSVSSVGTSIFDSNGEVDIEKRVKKVNDTGLYNVSFWVKGENITISKAKDIYVVFVIDRSYTMRLNNRWNNARDAVINISGELSKSGIEMALVGFSGGNSSKSMPWDDVVTLREFSSNAFTLNEFGNYDDDYIHGGGTNIQGGLLKAGELLSEKKGSKYVILLTDGVPTFYYDEDGNTHGPGNSDTALKLSKVPYCVNKTVIASDELKKQATIYAIGYDYDNLNNNFTYDGVDYDEKSLAFVTLTKIASDNKYYQASTNSNNTIANELKKIQLLLSNVPAGRNPYVVDGIGDKFKISTNNGYGGTKSLTKSSSFIIEEDFKEIGNFDVQIDTSVDTGWYSINSDFELTYQDYDGVTKSITCDKNPKVYWVNDYNYIVNYYKDSIGPSNFVGGYSGKASSGAVINKNDINLSKYIPEGYYIDNMYDINGNVIDSLTIDKNKDNVVNILYKIKRFDYVVNYYYADINNNYSFPEFSKIISNVLYGTEVMISNYYLKDNEIKRGYSLDTDVTSDMIYKITSDGVVIDIYYKLNKTNYIFSDRNFEDSNILPPQTGINVEKNILLINYVIPLFLLFIFLFSIKYIKRT